MKTIVGLSCVSLFLWIVPGGALAWAVAMALLMAGTLSNAYGPTVPQAAQRYIVPNVRDKKHSEVGEAPAGIIGLHLCRSLSRISLPVRDRARECYAAPEVSLEVSE